MIASAQISVYPLRQDRLGPAIEAVRALAEAAQLHVEQVSAQSTIPGPASWRD